MTTTDQNPCDVPDALDPARLRVLTIAEMTQGITTRELLDSVAEMGDRLVMLGAPAMTDEELAEVLEVLHLTGIRRCRQCGCTDDHGCISTNPDETIVCYWVAGDLCSACAL